MKVELFPKLTATTSYGLLRQVQKAMLEEPARVDMTVVVRDLEREDGDGWLACYMREQKRYPACGTQGCVWGWVKLIASPSNVYHMDGMASEYFPESAQKEADVLFYASGSDYFEEVGNLYPWPDDKKLTPGTPAYARAVVANIEKFIKRHYQALRHHRLPGARPVKNW